MIWGSHREIGKIHSYLGLDTSEGNEFINTCVYSDVKKNTTEANISPSPSKIQAKIN